MEAAFHRRRNQRQNGAKLRQSGARWSSGSGREDPCTLCRRHHYGFSSGGDRIDDILQFRKRLRLAVEVTLHLLAALLLEETEVFGILDAFGQHGYVEALGQDERRAHDRRGLPIVATLSMKPRSILILSNGKSCSVESDE